MEHNYGLNDNSYTSKRRPVEIIFYQEFIQFEQAEKFEKRVKKWSRRKKLALAESQFEKLKELAACANKSHYKNKEDFNE